MRVLSPFKRGGSCLQARRQGGLRGVCASHLTSPCPPTPPHPSPQPIFTGEGAVRFTAPGVEVLPSWFGGAGASAAAQRAVDACTWAAAGCTVMIQGPLFLDGPVELAPVAGVFATKKGRVGPPKGGGTAFEAFRLRPGWYSADRRASVGGLLGG